MGRGTGRCGPGIRRPGCRSADALDALFGGVGDLGQGGGGQIRELDILEIGPQIFHGIELGSISGQPLYGQPVALAVQAPGPVLEPRGCRDPSD
jgi:hypothetical protein